jgi:hypothetical protein
MAFFSYKARVGKVGYPVTFNVLVLCLYFSHLIYPHDQWFNGDGQGSGISGAGVGGLNASRPLKPNNWFTNSLKLRSP